MYPAIRRPWRAMLAKWPRQGYRLKRAGILDMFPQTAHVEAMAVRGRLGCLRNPTSPFEGWRSHRWATRTVVKVGKMVRVRAHQPVNTDGSINLEAWLDHVRTSSRARSSGLAGGLRVRSRIRAASDRHRTPGQKARPASRPDWKSPRSSRTSSWIRSPWSPRSSIEACGKARSPWKRSTSISGRWWPS